MVSPEPFAAAASVMALAGLGEWIHARRCRRMAHLAFGAGGRPRRWVRAAPLLRTAALVALAWGFLVFLQLDRAAEVRKEAAAQKEKDPLHHLVMALDVSPSMLLQDAGAGGQEARGARARALLRSILERIDLRAARLSIIAFYSQARPVVVDTFDAEVVHNVLNDLPLEHAFEPARTDLYSAVKSAAEVGRSWAPGTASLVLVSDGDTLPAREPPVLPPSFGGALVLGVGDPHRGLSIDGHSSRQDADSLQRLALRLGGHYHDGNLKHLPTEVLWKLCRSLPKRRPGPLDRKDLAAIAVGAGAAVLAGLAPLLAVLGASFSAPLAGKGSGPPAASSTGALDGDRP